MISNLQYPIKETPIDLKYYESILNNIRPDQTVQNIGLSVNSLNLESVRSYLTQIQDLLEETEDVI